MYIMIIIMMIIILLLLLLSLLRLTFNIVAGMSVTSMRQSWQ